MRNNNDLNKAWIIMWYKVRNGFINNAINIYEIWLIVEYAIIDLISLIEIAFNNDHNNVNNSINPNNKKNKLNESIISIINSLIIKPIITPAITIVELCNKAEIGVGADIAFNNQELNGNWADLVKEIIIKI